MKITSHQIYLSDILLIIVLSFTVNAILFVFIGINHPTYLQNYRSNNNPDGNQYVQLGENLWSKGVYSREDSPPYRPDANRTPIYPVVAGGMNRLFRSIWPLYTLQIALEIITSVLVYSAATLIFSRNIGFIAGIIYALDLMLAMLNFQVLSETLFSFLSTFSIFLWVRTLQKNPQASYQLLYYTTIGLVLALTILTRPTGLYVPIVLGFLSLVILHVRKQSYCLIAPLVLVLTAYILVFPWLARNYVLYGVPRLTTLDSLNVVYYVGAGVYRVRFGIDDLEEAQGKVASDYGLVPATKAHNFWLADEDLATMELKWRNAALDIFFKYPLSLVRSISISLAIGAMAHNAQDLAQASGRSWSNPGLANALHMDFPKFLKGLLENHVFVVLVFSWQLFMAGGSLILGLVGLIAGLIDRSHRSMCACLLIIAGYYMSNIVMQGLTPDARMRAPLLPLSYMLAAFGIIKLWQFVIPAHTKS
jgi:4-amino-4-deoxy-L-arabinose transferase-like glycosyltransferase